MAQREGVIDGQLTMERPGWAGFRQYSDSPHAQQPSTGQATVRSFFLLLATLLLLTAAAGLFGYFFLLEPGPHGRMAAARELGEIWLYRWGWLDRITEKQRKQLYESVCTRRCHSQAVIENRPRTAMEWDAIIARMRTIEQNGERARISEREAVTVAAHLKKYFLSTIPTVLPQAVMRLLKKDLWRMDFGDNDLFLDLIHLPLSHRSLVPYLVMKPGTTYTGEETLFIVYVNTHQGTVPRWDLAKLVTLSIGNDAAPLKPLAWQVLYEDDQQHHRQGLLTFPPIHLAEGKEVTMQMTVQLPDMPARNFQWSLPVPPLESPL
ncbi:MAG: hypothetical protein H7836_02760 [Magnetococcus sp. YQC-3]